jgi:O-antigen/teichoic acid export membrane protein
VEPAKSLFLRNLLILGCANVLSLVCNGILTFLLPRVLSMESYGEYRLFVLYGGFAGIMHLGLLDGALLRWAARSKSRMRAEMRHNLVFLLLQHGAFLLPPTAILVVWFRHRPWCWLALTILLYSAIWNTAVLGQFALQAEKSFVMLSAATFIQPALLLGVVAALNHWKHLTLHALLTAYLGSMLLSGAGVWMLLLSKYPGKMRGTQRIWQSGFHNIRAGWNVLLAALFTNVAMSLDRVVVSFCFGLRDFAIYSLAATALAVVNTVILSVSQVVFPYLADGLSGERKERAYACGESCVLTLWAISLMAYFPLGVLILRFLPAYSFSLPILKILMLATGLTAVIYILHSSYFRSTSRQWSLLLGATCGLLAAAMFLSLARRTGHLTNISWAMLGAVSLWWTVNELLLRDLTRRTLRQIGRTILFSAACIGCFLFCAVLRNTWVALLSYGTATVVITSLTYGQTLRSLVRHEGEPSFRF